MNVNINSISNTNLSHNLKTQKNNSTNVLNESRQINELTNYYYPAFKATQVPMEKIAKSVQEITETDIKQILTAEQLVKLKNKIEDTIIQCNQILGKKESTETQNVKAQLEKYLSVVQEKLGTIRRGEVNNFLQQLSTDIRKRTSFSNKDSIELKNWIEKIDELRQFNVCEEDLNGYRALLNEIPNYQKCGFYDLIELYKECGNSKDTPAYVKDKRFVVEKVLEEDFPKYFKLFKINNNNNR